MIDADTRSWALALAEELEHSHLVVALTPAPRPQHRDHCVRQAVEFNPDWYRRLCRSRPSTRMDRRNFQTAIKRQHTLRGLRSIAAGRRGRYASLLLGVIDRCRADDAAHMGQDLNACL